MQQRHIIYALLDPMTGLVRYIGKSATGLKRPRQHWEPAALRKDTNPYKRTWLERLICSGKKPIIAVLEYCAEAKDISRGEVHWIKVFRGVDAPLTNLTAGGDGAGIGNQIWRGRTHSKETRKALSLALRGNKNSLGYTHSAEAVARSSAASVGRSPSLETRAKLRAAKLGKKRGPHSPETRAKMSAAHKLRLGNKHV